jgi:hypothetical protein
MVNGVVLAAMITGLITVIVFYLGQQTQRKSEEFQRKETMYSNLISNAPGFYTDAYDYEMQKAFIKNASLCWMYCSDEVIRKLNALLNALEKKEGEGDKKIDSRLLLGELILEIRKELISRKKVTSTVLAASEYKAVAVNQPNGQG